MTCLFEAAFFFVPLVSGGFKRLHAILHISLEDLSVLTLLLPQWHKMTAVVGLVLHTTEKKYT